MFQKTYVEKLLIKFKSQIFPVANLNSLKLIQITRMLNHFNETIGLIFLSSDQKI